VNITAIETNKDKISNPEKLI